MSSLRACAGRCRVRLAPQATRGTTFHQWLEQRYGQAQLIDADDLAAFADDFASAADAELAELKAAFEAGEWANRWPAEVEVGFETLIADRLVRGRIDAVFADAPDGRYDVVDWKTGRQPRSAAEKRSVAVQLAAYRLARAALADVPLDEVRAASTTSATMPPCARPTCWTGLVSPHSSTILRLRPDLSASRPSGLLAETG